MPIKKYTADADTTITNAYKPPALQTRATGSNMGASDAVQIFSLYGQVSSSAGTFTSVEKSRVLVKFPIANILSDRNSNKIPTSGSVSFYLNLFNARTPFTLPKDYTLRVQPVMRSWEEGAGLDMDTYIDTGYANWIVAASSSTGVVTNWTKEGGDFEYNSAFGEYFSVGNEDMSIDITSLVEEWLGAYNSWAPSVSAPTKLTASGDQVVTYPYAYFGYSSNIATSRYGASSGYTASFSAPLDARRPPFEFPEALSGSVRVWEGLDNNIAGGEWVETVLTASNGRANDYFGLSTSMTRAGSTILVGAPYHPWVSPSAGSGTAYLFQPSGFGSWAAPNDSPISETTNLDATDAVAGDGFGYSVAISDDARVAVVGAPFADVTYTDEGSAYVFLADGNGLWTQTYYHTQSLKLKLSSADSEYRFGNTCGINGDGSVIVVGAPHATASSNDRQGALYIYERPTRGWASGSQLESAVLTTNTYSSASLKLGFWPSSLDISGDGNTIVVGAHSANNSTGSAYVFEKPSTGWADMTETSVLEPYNTPGAPIEFGKSVAISEDASTIAVGAHVSGSADALRDGLSGSVYLFEKTSVGYVPPLSYSTQKVTNTGITTGNRSFGGSVALNDSGSALAVGEYGLPDAVSPPGLSGSGYVFKRPSTGTRPNYGVGVFLKRDQEDGSQQKSYYIKKFFAKGTEYFFKKPSIEARWNDSIKDDRGDFYLSSALAPAADNLNTLYLYNYIRGRLRNIPVVGTGSILMSLYSGTTAPTSGKLELPAGGGLVTTGHHNVTGGWVETGIYSASVATTSSVSQAPTLFNRFARSSDTVVEYLYDVWHSASTEYFTGSGISPQNIAASNIQPGEDWVTTITNLKASYKTIEKPRLRIFTRPQNWRPSIYTVSTTAISPTILRDSYYKIFRIYDNMDAVPYGTGSIKYTQLSYDVSGSYFDFNMDLLEPGYAYGVKIMSIDDGVEFEHPETFKFRVE